MNAMKIKINTSEVGPEASTLMEELTKALQAQLSDQEIAVVEDTVAVPNTKGLELNEVLLSVVVGVTSDIMVSLISRLANGLIEKLFPPRETKNVSIEESPNGVVISNNGNNNSYSITINVIDD